MDEILLRISNTVQDSIVDGIGLRYTIFFQGCTANCDGCHNPQTHDLKGGRQMSAAMLLDEIKNNPLTSGVTFSGGEPFLQAENISLLAKEIKRLGLNIWCYTGMTWEYLATDRHTRKLLEQVDVLIDGRFELKKRSLTTSWRGSTNQRIIDVQQSLKKGELVLLMVD